MKNMTIQPITPVVTRRSAEFVSVARAPIHLINDEVFVGRQIATATTSAWIGANDFFRTTAVNPAACMARYGTLSTSTWRVSDWCRLFILVLASVVARHVWSWVRFRFVSGLVVGGLAVLRLVGTVVFVVFTVVRVIVVVFVIAIAVLMRTMVLIDVIAMIFVVLIVVVVSCWVMGSGCIHRLWVSTVVISAFDVGRHGIRIG